MMRKLLATTALAMAFATGALAQDTTAPAPAAPNSNPAVPAAPTAPAVKADGQLATNIVGESVYNGTAEDAESIGKVTDVVFDKDGQARSVVIGVGGFLGVGAKNVAFDYDKLQWAEKNGDRWLVAQTSKDELTAQPAFDDTPYRPVAVSQAAQPATPPGTTAPADGMAQNAAPVEPAKPAALEQGQLASMIMGEKVYNGSGDEAQNIGSVNDIVVSKQGKAQALVIGVGGFLGLGQKNVAFDFDKARPMERSGERWLVVDASKEQLQGLPDFDRKAYDPAPAAAAAGADAPAMVTPTTDTAQNEPAADDQASTPDQTSTAAIDRSNLAEMPTDRISADDLIGTTVYGADDADVGKIADVVLSADDKVDAVVIDVGGFLGIGSKPIAVGMDNLKFMTDQKGSTYLYTNFTKEQLEAQAAYDKGSYAQNRDAQRMIMRP